MSQQWSESKATAPQGGSQGTPLSPHPTAQRAASSAFHSLVGNEASDACPSLLLGDSKFWGIQELHWSQNMRWDLRLGTVRASASSHSWCGGTTQPHCFLLHSGNQTINAIFFVGRFYQTFFFFFVLCYSKIISLWHIILRYTTYLSDFL